MDTSTYFDLNLVTGSDKVNPLTVDRPNYEKIDDQMHKNQINSVVEATELKSGNVHAITCLTEGAVFFRFTATSDFTTGDTFTFNGTPVSAVLPDGSGLQTGAFKINGTVLCSVIGSLLTVYSFTTSDIAADSEKLGGQLPAYYAKAADAIGTYVHSRIGTVNNFVGNGANGKVKLVANIEAGDTFQVNGQTVTAYFGTDNAAESMAGNSWAGKWITFVTQDNLLFFPGGNAPAPSSVLFSVSRRLTQQLVSNNEQNPRIEISQGLFTKQSENTVLRVAVSGIMKTSNFVGGVGVFIDNTLYPIALSDSKDFMTLCGTLVIEGISAGQHSFRFVAYGSANTGSTATITMAAYQYASADCIEAEKTV